MLGQAGYTLVFVTHFWLRVCCYHHVFVFGLLSTIPMRRNVASFDRLVVQEMQINLQSIYDNISNQQM